MPWLRIAGVALFVFFVVVAAMEIRLAQLGYRSTVLDSREQWVAERSRASDLGPRALVLVGKSRIQYGVDLDRLRTETGLTPVQLGVEGRSFVPILRGLAGDPAVRGTILVEYYPEVIEGALSGAYEGAAAGFQKAFENEAPGHGLFSLAEAERILTKALHENLRSFADGATPLTSLQFRILPGSRDRQYLVTLPDRSRLADFSLVSMPGFYHNRVVRELGEAMDAAAPNFESTLRARIDLLKPHDNADFIKGARYLSQQVAAIQAHGGRVLFVEMPTTGMVREINEKRYPRASFLRVFEKEIGLSVLNSTDTVALQQFDCPDGSHLDFRDRSRFTGLLVRSLGIGRVR